MGYMKDLLITVYGGGDEAVDAAEKLAGLNRWIPVSERLPEDGEKVIAFFHRFGDVGEAVYDKDINAFSAGRGGCWDATHWMPLPPKPPEAT